MLLAEISIWPMDKGESVGEIRSSRSRRHRQKRPALQARSPRHLHRRRMGRGHGRLQTMPRSAGRRLQSNRLYHQNGLAERTLGIDRGEDKVGGGKGGAEVAEVIRGTGFRQVQSSASCPCWDRRGAFFREGANDRNPDQRGYPNFQRSAALATRCISEIRYSPSKFPQFVILKLKGFTDETARIRPPYRT